MICVYKRRNYDEGVCNYMKWEYKILKAGEVSNFNNSVKLQEELNNYGMEGWELVNFVYPEQKGKGWEPAKDLNSVIFKRQIANN
jgi:hypothetical protein